MIILFCSYPIIAREGGGKEGGIRCSVCTINEGQVHSMLVRYWIRPRIPWKIHKYTHTHTFFHACTHGSYGLYDRIMENVATYDIKFNLVLFVYTCCVRSRAFPFIYIAITFVALDRCDRVRKRFSWLSLNSREKERSIFHALVCLSSSSFLCCLRKLSRNMM